MSSRAGAGPALGRGASPRGLPGPQRVVVGCPGSWPWQGPQLLAPQPHQHRRHGPWHRRAGRAAGGQLRRPPVPADLRAPVRAGSGAPWCVWGGRWEGVAPCWRCLGLVSGLEGPPAPGTPDRPSRCCSECRSGRGLGGRGWVGGGGPCRHLDASLQEKRFLRMLAEAGAPALQRHEVPAELLQPLLPRYEAALSELESAVKVGPRP